MHTQAVSKIKENIKKVIIGNEETINLILTALAAGGHVLLEDVPGTGKTLMAKTLARSIGGKFSRVQFTPDLLPSDLTGINYYNRKEDEFIFREGPVFTNILLADEINRATPRTQAGLLECMAEGRVTSDGETRILPRPFFVIATQNPIETAGTFPLPEAQLDRFMMKLSMSISKKEEELSIINRFLKDDPSEETDEVCSTDDLLKLREDYKHVFIHPMLLEYIAELVIGTRSDSGVLLGVSPRGTLALVNAVRAYAMISGRDYVIPEDIKKLAVPTLCHRIILKGSSADGAKRFMDSLLQSLPVPTEDWNKR